MGEPHACRQTFPANVTDRKHQVTATFEEADEISGQMTHWKNLAGNLKGPKAPVARSAEFSLHLGSLKQRPPHVIVLTAQLRKLLFESNVVACRFLRPRELAWAPEPLCPMDPCAACALSNWRYALQFRFLQKTSGQPTNL
jgi:hypothetical protein